MKFAKLLQLFFILSIIIVPSCDDNDEELVVPEEVTIISFEEGTFVEDEFIIFLTEDPNGKTISFGPGIYNFTNTCCY